MNSFKRSLALLVSAAALLFGALVPALVSAQVYYPSMYNNNCYGNSGYYYDGSQNYNYNNYNYNCNGQGTVTIYTQINNQYGGSASASNFTYYVSGATSGQQYVTGSTNGTAVWVSGSYAVSLYNQSGYTPTYSSGCSGTLTYNQNATCYVTLTSVYNNQYQYPYNQYQYYQPYVQPTSIVATPVTIVSKYVPTLPNTGYEPISATTVGFALALLAVFGALLLPYVRKALATVLR